MVLSSCSRRFQLLATSFQLQIARPIDGTRTLGKESGTIVTAPAPRNAALKHKEDTLTILIHKESSTLRSVIGHTALQVGQKLRNCEREREKDY